jgi:hypothetical protein
VGNLLDDWSGPTVDFIQLAATVAHMTLEPFQEFPNRLYQEPVLFFDTTSTFDACLFATSLGLIDLCVASYGITSRRATVGKFVVLGIMPVRLVIQEDFYLRTDLKLYIESMKTIFEPLRPETWSQEKDTHCNKTMVGQVLFDQF